MNSLYDNRMDYSKIWGILNKLYPERDLYPGERNYFQSNPHVSGMATEDNAIIINPYSNLNQDEFNSVRNNERLRLYLRSLNMTPSFDITPEQKNYFIGTPYKNSPEVKNTLIARYMTGDPSAQNITSNQNKFANSLYNMIINGYGK